MILYIPSYWKSVAVYNANILPRVTQILQTRLGKHKYSMCKYNNLKKTPLILAMHIAYESEKELVNNIHRNI